MGEREPSGIRTVLGDRKRGNWELPRVGQKGGKLEGWGGGGWARAGAAVVSSPQPGIKLPGQAICPEKLPSFLGFRLVLPLKGLREEGDPLELREAGQQLRLLLRQAQPCN